MPKNKIFEAEEFKMCENCLYSKSFPDSELVICKKYGIKNFDEICRHFEIDLLSVNPKKLRSFSTALTQEDFEL